MERAEKTGLGIALVAYGIARERAGGTVVTPPYDFPGGRRFHFRDPAGNVLSVIVG